jgi:hypothetical protein
VTGTKAWEFLMEDLDGWERIVFQRIFQDVETIDYATSATMSATAFLILLSRACEKVGRRGSVLWSQPVPPDVGRVSL